MKTKYDSTCCYCKAFVPARTGSCWNYAKTKRWYVACDNCTQAKREERKANKDIRIEFPSKGATYNNPVYGVYQYDVYPHGTVNYGKPRRTWLNEFPSKEEALNEYPNAVVIDGSCFHGVCEAE